MIDILLDYLHAFMYCLVPPSIHSIIDKFFIYLFIYLFIGQSFEGQKGLFGRLCYLTNVLAIFAFDEYP